MHKGCSGKVNLSEWESYVPTRATQAQSTQRRWQRFLRNDRIRVRSLYVPLVMAAISNWNQQRLYLALDTTMLWNRFCIIHVSIVCSLEQFPACSVLYAEETSARAVRFLWKVFGT